MSDIRVLTWGYKLNIVYEKLLHVFGCINEDQYGYIDEHARHMIIDWRGREQPTTE